MTKNFLTLAAAAALVLACSPRVEAAAQTVMTLDGGGGVTASIDELGGCIPGGGGCTNLTITVDGAHGTIDVKTKKGTDFNGFVIHATGIGGGDSFLPTLMNLNSIDAESVNAGGGTLTTTFTDTLYPNMSALLKISDSNTTDTQIAASSIAFSVFTDAGNAIPAGTLVHTNTFTGDSNSATFFKPNTNASGSLTTQTIMAFTGLGAIQANITVANVVVPEPASVVFLGTTMLGLTALFRKKFQGKR